MADISRLMFKQAGRAKEKILQNLGKADKTTDEILEEHIENFNIQQTNSAKLQKDVSSYLRCVRAMQAASKCLMETLVNIYEDGWVGKESLIAKAQTGDMLWSDFIQELTDQLVIPLTSYQAQFPEIKKKIDKRNRKLTDYDSERHAVQQMQSNPNRNEAKLFRAQEQMQSARKTYEAHNHELHDELPALYNSRILFSMTSMQSLFTTQKLFHSETEKVYRELEGVVDTLSTEHDRGTLPVKTIPKPIKSHVNDIDLPNLHSASQKDSLMSPPEDNRFVSPNSLRRLYEFSAGMLSHVKSYYNPTLWNSDSGMASPKQSQFPERSIDREQPPVEVTSLPTCLATAPSEEEQSIIPTVVPSSATTENLSPGVLYQVKAAYKYQAEDVDELKFEVGDIIDVVEYEDPEEQEEGWLRGVISSSGQKGLFPANFTKPI